MQGTDGSGNHVLDRRQGAGDDAGSESAGVEAVPDLQDLHGLEGATGGVAARRADWRQKAVDVVGLIVRRQDVASQMGGDERRQLGGNGQPLSGFSVVGEQCGVLQADGGGLKRLHRVQSSREVKHKALSEGAKRFIAICKAGFDGA